jgi:putative addiction module killer protein
VNVTWTTTFRKWLDDLPDPIAAALIAARIARLREGLFGNVRSLGGGLAEMKIDHGPGYRVYYARRGQELILLLCGGDKSTQSRDTARARAIAEEVKK